jgi:hypothetical protein
MLATVVDTEALWQTIVYALVSAVGVTAIFAIAIRGVARFGDYNRDGRSVSASLWGAMAILGFVATAAAIVVGVIVMSSK